MVSRFFLFIRPSDHAIFKPRRGSISVDEQSQCNLLLSLRNFNYLNTSVLKSAVRGPVSGLKRNICFLFGCNAETDALSEEAPPGGASGKPTQAKNEVVYVLQGSIIVEEQGKPPVTLKTGEAFTMGP